MEPLISVIVPVYKVEQYLAQCVDSILNQTYRNLEVILVDDGSPDNCGTICDAYAGKDSRVKVIHKENGGLSSARNAGMELATGEYLNFTDSDDILPDNALEHMLILAMKEHADLVIGNHMRFEDVLPVVSEDVADVRVLSKEEAMVEFFKNGCAAWARLYRREIHEGIVFPDGEINEDEAIVLQILDRCNRIEYTSGIVYLYRCRTESITTSSFSEKKLIWVKHCRENLAFIREKYPTLESYALSRYRGSILWVLTEIALSNDSFSKETAELLFELRGNARSFWKIPFAFSQDRIRLLFLWYGPFSLYRVLIRKKRGIE